MKFKKQIFGFMDMLRFKKLVPNRREPQAGEQLRVFLHHHHAGHQAVPIRCLVTVDHALRMAAVTRVRGGRCNADLLNGVADLASGLALKHTDHILCHTVLCFEVIRLRHVAPVV